MAKRFLILGLIFIMLFLTGCWNRREPEDYAWLNWVGLDAVNGKVQMTAALSPALSPVPTGSAPPEDLLLVSTATGDTVFEALRNMTLHVPKRIFWGYLQAVIISEDLARRGVEENLDLLFRDPEIRKNAWVFVVKGNTAPIFEIDPQLEKNPAKIIAGLVKSEQAGQGKSRILRLRELQCALGDPGADPVVSVLGVCDPRKKLILPPGEKPPKNSELALDGSAVFRGDKLIDWLSPMESQTLLIGRGELKGALIVIDHPDDARNKVGIEIVKCKTKMKASLDGTQAKVSLDITLQGQAAEQKFSVPGKKSPDPTGDPEFYHQLEAILATKVKKDLQNLVERSQQELDSDILCVGFYLSTRYPNEWEIVKSDWRKYYSQAEFDINVKANILASATMKSRYPEPD